MKYIRTKDGAIYEIVDDKYLIFDGNKIPVDINKLEKEYKVVDTIEKLCDEFVVVDVNSHWTYQTINYELKTLKESFVNNETIYGAIWTNKGLIYVAKMNKKGKWELL